MMSCCSACKSAGNDAQGAEAGSGLQEAAAESRLQGPAAGSASPAEIPSIPSTSDIGTAISDGEISANLQAFYKDHRYCKKWAASAMANGLGEDEAEMRPVADSATSETPRSGLTWPEVSATATAEVSVSSPSPIDSLTFATAPRAGSSDMPSTSRQVRDNTAIAGAAAMVVGIEHLLCTQCGKSYEHKVRLEKSHERKVRLEKHFVIHTLERSACSSCGQMFAQLLRFSVLGPYACSSCRRFFNSKENLRRHELRIHAVDRPYACDRCDRQFARRVFLSIHMKVHIAADRRRQLAASRSAAAEL